MSPFFAHPPKTTSSSSSITQGGGGGERRNQSIEREFFFSSFPPLSSPATATDNFSGPLPTPAPTSPPLGGRRRRTSCSSVCPLLSLSSISHTAAFLSPPSPSPSFYVLHAWLSPIFLGLSGIESGQNGYQASWAIWLLPFHRPPVVAEARPCRRPTRPMSSTSKKMDQPTDRPLILPAAWGSPPPPRKQQKRGGMESSGSELGQQSISQPMGR